MTRCEPFKELPPALVALCKALPFLSELPDDLLRQLDTSTLLLPSGKVAAQRVRLEARLGCHVMSYRRSPSVLHAGGGTLHLCRLLRPASLTPEQIEDLRIGETACGDGGVVFVAYRRPLQLRVLDLSM